MKRFSSLRVVPRGAVRLAAEFRDGVCQTLQRTKA